MSQHVLLVKMVVLAPSMFILSLNMEARRWVSTWPSLGILFSSFWWSQMSSVMMLGVHLRLSSFVVIKWWPNKVQMHWFRVRMEMFSSSIFTYLWDNTAGCCPYVCVTVSLWCTVLWDFHMKLNILDCLWFICLTLAGILKPIYRRRKLVCKLWPENLLGKF